MKRTNAFALLAGVALSAAAPPPRLVHLEIATAQAPQILIQCIEHQLVGLSVADVPLDGGGVSIQVSQANNIFHRAPMEYWNIVPVAGVNHLTMSYRHPMSERTAAKVIRIVGRKCFAYELDAAGGGKLPDNGS